jgi:foldase protein PrsA
MTKKLLTVFALPVLAVALLVAGCGSGVPSDSVATVDGTPIKKADFDHWLSVAAKQSAPPGSTAAPAVPDPPDYTNCVARFRSSRCRRVRRLPRPPRSRRSARSSTPG